MHVVQQAVQNGRGQHLVAREDLRPIPHVLVAREDDRALLVPRRDQAEEQVGLVAVQRPEAHLVDDPQTGSLLLSPTGRGNGRSDPRFGTPRCARPPPTLPPVRACCQPAASAAVIPGRVGQLRPAPFRRGAFLPTQVYN